MIQANAPYNLDDPTLYTALDPSGLRQRIRALPEHCIAAWNQSRVHQLPPEWATADKVVIGGMGGSAIAGDLVSDLLAGPDSVPVLVVRDLRIPFALDEDALFIACSYSGNTEETLALFDQAVKAGAKILAIGSGGILAQRAKEIGIPFLTVGIATEPRTALGYNLMLLLGALKQAGLATIVDDDVTAAIDALERRAPRLHEDSPLANNPAKKLAVELVNKVIVVYGSGLFSGVARRWKSQFNENAKTWAFSEVVPEVLHNSAEAYASASPVADRITGLVLEPAAGEGCHARHNNVVSQLLIKNHVAHQVVTGETGSPLQQLLEMLLLGDYVSYYLALLQGVDPAPNPTIDVAKMLLADQT